MIKKRVRRGDFLVGVGLGFSGAYCVSLLGMGVSCSSSGNALQRQHCY